MMQIAKKAMPMIGYFMLALLLITFIPAISLCLFNKEGENLKNCKKKILCVSLQGQYFFKWLRE